MGLLDGDLINACLIDPVDDRVSQLAHQLEGAKDIRHSWMRVGDDIIAAFFFLKKAVMRILWQ